MTTITIPRALLEQALEALDVSRRFVYQDSRPQVDTAFDALNNELAKPARCAQCGYQYGHQIGCVNNPVDIALSKQAIRAELAKPEQEESFIPDWANYRQGVADGKAGSPKWQDAPTVPGLWSNSVNWRVHKVLEETIGAYQDTNARWYGPIPQDGEKS